MKICVFGAGAVGGVVAAHLGRAGEEISVIARGPHLEVIKQKGLTLETAGGKTLVAHPFASDDPAALGPQDAVIVAVKAPALPALADTIGPLLGPETPVVFAMNGMPWWYFYKLAGPYEGRRLELIDPGGKVWSAVGPERVIGCVVDAPAEMIGPGVVVARNEICKFTLGEPDGGASARITAIADAMNGAGLVAEVSERIREDVWNKLFGNMIVAPVAALTRATAGQLFADAELMAICRQAMEEGERVANEFGESFDLDFEKRLAVGGGNPAHKQSMLQDVEQGRPMEIDALVSIVCELGRTVGVETPVMDMVLALVKQQARVLGLYRG